VALTPEALAGRKDHFWERTAHYRSLGYDRVAWARGFLGLLGFNELKASAGRLHQSSVLRAPSA
jgi:hypothetical protein